MKLPWKPEEKRRRRRGGVARGRIPTAADRFAGGAPTGPASLGILRPSGRLSPREREIRRWRHLFGRHPADEALGRAGIARWDAERGASELDGLIDRARGDGR